MKKATKEKTSLDDQLKWANENISAIQAAMHVEKDEKKLAGYKESVRMLLRIRDSLIELFTIKASVKNDGTLKVTK